MTLYTPQLDGSGFALRQTGAQRPFTTRDIQALTFVFALIILPQSTQTIYIRYEHSRSRNLPLRLYTPARFARANQLAMWRLAITFGIWLFLFCGTFLLWYRLRSQLFFTLVVITGAILFNQLLNEGIGRQYVWPNLTFLPRGIDMVGGGLVYLGFLWFVTLFLETKEQYPRWHKVLNSLMILCLLVLIQMPFVADRFVAQQLVFLFLVMFAIMLVFGLRAWLHTYRTTRELTMVPAVIVAFVIFGILAVLPNLGILARAAQTDQIDFMGFITFAVLLSTLIADRFAAGFQKQQEAQRKQAEIAAELRVVNEGLEQRVDARTFELRQARDDAREAQSAAEAANHAKSTFLSNMSHELRTPLNSILGYSHLVAGDANLPPEQQQHLHVVQRSGEHLLLLIDDILEMARIEAGRTTLNAAPFDLHQLLTDLADLFRVRTQNKGIHLDVAFPADIPQFIETDGRKLRQVLMNLLSNAVKFTDVGGVVLRAEIRDWRLETRDRQSPIPNLQSPVSITFAVTDTGPGIAADELEIIFAPFGQTSMGQQAHGGTGLGLAIARQFVELMSGELQAQSTQGLMTDDERGTTFYFTIPVHVVEPLLVDESDQLPRIIGLVAHQSQYRVLVADDDANSRALLANLLTPVGFDVRTTADGAEALAMWRQWQPDILLTDLRMPGMDGLTVTRQIRTKTIGLVDGATTTSSTTNSATGAPANPLIIAVTASSFREEDATILAAGCDDILRKPFRVPALFDMLQKHLGIEYVYADRAAAPHDVATLAPALDSAAATQAFAALPADLVTRLSQAAIRSDMAGVEQAITEVRAQNADVGALLAELAREFAYERIVGLIEGGRFIITTSTGG